MLIQHQKLGFPINIWVWDIEKLEKTIGLKCLQTIPQRVTFLHDDRINLNIHKNMFRNLYVDPTSETWFPNKYIEADIKKKLDKTRGQLASD